MADVAASVLAKLRNKAKDSLICISISFLPSDLSMRMVHGEQNQEKNMSLTQTVTGYPMPAEKAIKAGK